MPPSRRGEDGGEEANEETTMWARVSRFHEPRERIDEDIRDTQEVAAELVRRTKGSRGMYYMVDRDTGETMVITLWEDKQAMVDSEQEAARLREESSSRPDARILKVQRFEVVLEPSDVL